MLMVTMVQYGKMKTRFVEVVYENANEGPIFESLKIDIKIKQRSL